MTFKAGKWLLKQLVCICICISYSVSETGITTFIFVINHFVYLVLEFITVFKLVRCQEVQYFQ